MKYSVGDRIIFNKDYELNWGKDKYSIKDANGWIEEWLIGQTATITEIEKAIGGNFYWYYIDIPDTHGYDEALFNKVDEVDEVFVEL